MKTKKILSSLLLIGLFFFFNPVSADWLAGLGQAGAYGLPDTSVEDIIRNILMWILYIFTILCVIAFVIAGVMFLMAGSNAKMAEQAKNAVTFSIIGIAIGLSGYIIIRLADNLLRGTF
jgi:hypothetical protein